MSEKGFQSYIIRSLQFNNYFVRFMDLNNCPGFPDLFIAKNNKSAFIELKEIKIKKDYAIKRMFQKSQPAFYLELLKNYKNLFLFFRSYEGNEKERFFCIFRITPFFIKKLNEIYYSNIDKYVISFLKTRKFNTIYKWLEINL